MSKLRTPLTELVGIEVRPYELVTAQMTTDDVNV